ncbi:hypothetical protein C8F01DRAFT_1255255 [Mycena amicta]|nr:hypothetical protein C8F01DRAFT_1255255 [Mycena amicta]
MSAPTPAQLLPIPSFGYLPHHTGHSLPDLPSRDQPGHAEFRAVAVYDVTGVLRHHLMPLRHTQGQGNTVREQSASFRAFWSYSPIGCEICALWLFSAVSESHPTAYTFFMPCRHAPDAQDLGTQPDSDDDNPDIAVEDRDPDVVPNAPVMYLVSDLPGCPILRGNLVVVKHSVVDGLPEHVLDAELYDVDREDFVLINRLVRRHLSAEGNCSPYVLRSMPYQQRNQILRSLEDGS